MEGDWQVGGGGMGRGDPLAAADLVRHKVRTGDAVRIQRTASDRYMLPASAAGSTVEHARLLVRTLTHICRYP